jgi:DNA-binding winged helix-turn-helix (wHTH) protein
MNESPLVRFGVFEMDVRTGELRKHGVRLKIQDQPFQVLQALVERPGELVTREELQTRIWANDTFVDFDQSLNRAINKVRDVLSDTAASPRFIETLPRRGYRFIAPVEAAPKSGPMEAAPRPEPPPHSVGVLREEAPRDPAAVEVKVRSRTPLAWVVVAVLMVLVATSAAWSLRTKADEPPRSAPTPLTTYPGSETQPTFSPDGNQVAFAWTGEKQDNLDIYVKAVGSEASLRLTTNPAADFMPAWSPDGKMIAFLRGRASGIDVMLIPALGGPERQLSSFVVNAERSGYGLFWVANSRWLAAGLPERA